MVGIAVAVALFIVMARAMLTLVKRIDEKLDVIEREMGEAMEKFGLRRSRI
jgi:hypothetical protein